MTVHGAKGLQAPIVFLPDTIKMAVHSSHLLWLDKKDNNNKTNEFMIWLPRINDQDEICKIASNIYDIQRNKEYIRLLYVAMTRAEDRLYICGWKSNIETDTKTHCWYNLIFNALKPVCISELDATLAQQSGIENFEVLRLTSDQTADVLSKKITTKPITSQTLPAWINEKAPFETSPRSLVPSHLNNESEILQSFGETNRIRFQRGNLIHRILQSLPNLEPDKRNEAIINFLSQPYWKLSFLEQTTLISNIIAILNNQQFAPIFGTGSLAEVPIVGFLNKKIVSGQIDRLLVTKTEVLIIDYKTNKQPPLSANDVTLANLHQIAIYKAILSNIYSNRTISCALLWTNIPQLMVIDNDLLNDALFRILRT
jgi:ATP-dependent helicase/nuclease subunit A